MKNPEIEGMFMTNPPLSHQPIGMNEKLFLQIRICGEDSLGVRKLKKEYQMELPSGVLNLETAYLHPKGTLDEDGYWAPAVIIPVNLPVHASDLPEATTPIQHESKVI